MHLKATQLGADRYNCYLDGKKVLAVEAHEEEGWVDCYTRGGRPALVNEKQPGLALNLDSVPYQGPTVARFHGHVMLVKRLVKDEFADRACRVDPVALREDDGKTAGDCWRKHEDVRQFGGFPPLVQRNDTPSGRLQYVRESVPGTPLAEGPVVKVLKARANGHDLKLVADSSVPYGQGVVDRAAGVCRVHPDCLQPPPGPFKAEVFKPEPPRVVHLEKWAEASFELTDAEFEHIRADVKGAE
jgi:hypothetical protein